jgi:hypothetical protein
MKKLVVYTTLLLVALPLLFFAVPVQAKREPPAIPVTSLSIWKDSCHMQDNGDGTFTLQGTIYVQNTGANIGYITGITDVVEAKYKGNNPWQALPTALQLFFFGDNIIAPGETEYYGYIITFTKGTFDSYRNVVTVTLGNHPDGTHDFVYRFPFDV